MSQLEELELEWDDHETCTDLLIIKTPKSSFFENPMTPAELMRILREITLCKLQVISKIFYWKTNSGVLIAADTPPTTIMRSLKKLNLLSHAEIIL